MFHLFARYFAPVRLARLAADARLVRLDLTGQRLVVVLRP